MEDKDFIFKGQNTFPHDIDVLNNPDMETFYFRYFVAAHFCKDKDVLDAACGYGYGTNFLRTYANEVTGIDVDPKAIKWARKKYTGINFIQHNILNEKKELENKFDVVVSIETFEHIPRHLVEVYLNNLKKWVKDGGTILIITPQRDTVWQYNGGSHLYEYSFDEFRGILFNVFRQEFGIFGLMEIMMGSRMQLISLVENKKVRECKSLCAVIENVKKV